MATSILLNGVSYSIPATGESGWGTNVSSYLIALSTGTFTKAGGAFTLLADADFGLNFGLKSVYFKSRGTAATSGVLRLGNLEAVSWRDAANSADLALKVNASDKLEFNGTEVVSLALGSAYYVLQMNSAGTAYTWSAVTGTGSPVLDTAPTITSPTLVTPDLGTPSAAVLTNATGLPVSTGISGLGAGVASFLATPSSANLASALTDETGSGSAVFANTPTLVTPVLGAATATSINGTAIPASATLVKTTDKLSALAATTSAELAGVISDETGSGALVFDTSPSLTTPSMTSPTVSTGMDLLAQAPLRLQDTSGGEYVALRANGTTTTHTLTLPATQGVSGTVLTNDGSGNLSWNTGSGGAGEKNYISIGSNTAANWSASSASITVATTTTAAELPRANTTLSGIKITGVSGSTAYAYYRFTLDEADYNRKLKIKFDLRPVTGYVASDMKVDLYSNTASDYGGTSTRIATSGDSSYIFEIPNATGQIQVAVDMPGSSAPYMELRIGLNATSTKSIVISDVVVGPGIQPQGAVIGNWISYTPTIGADTTAPTESSATKACLYRRVGDSMEINFSFTQTGAGSAGSGQYRFPLPTGFTIDTSKFNTTSELNTLGVGYVYAGSGSTERVGFTFVDAANASYFKLGYSNDVGVVAIVGSTATPFAANVRYEGTVLVPINQWAGSGTVNVSQNDVEYVYNTSGLTTAGGSNTTSFGYGPVGALIGSIASTTVTGNSTTNMRVRFQTPIQASDLLILEVDNGSTGRWVPMGSEPSIAANIAQGTGTFGVSYRIVNSTDVDIYFGNGGRTSSNATYGSAGSAWSGVSTWRWRLKKVTGGQAVGFGLATTTSSGLVNPYTAGSGVVYAGTYTPTFVSNNSGVVTTANITLPANSLFQYIRVGAIVTVSGVLYCNASSAGAADIRISLPIATTLAGLGDVAGTAATNANNTATVRSPGGTVLADIGNQVARCVSTIGNAGSEAIAIVFTYIIK